LKLLHVVDSLERGGLERVVVDLAGAQQAAGDSVTVFSINETAGFRPELEARGIAVIVGAKRRSFDLRTICRLRAAARGAAVVHAHNFVPNYYAATALLGLRGGPALVGTCHDMGTRLSHRRLRWFYRWSLTRTAGVAMVGRQVYERFVSSGLVAPDRATLVLNGIPVERFGAAQEQRAAARRALALDADALVVGCVGRLVALKNHRILIGLLPELARSFAPLRLVLVGGGVLEAELRRQADELGVADRVVFAGERAGVAELLPAFDVFVLPSLTEGLSIALLEACAAALPIVATAVGGNPEIVGPAHAGELVPPDDAPALSAALARLLADEPARRRAGEAARRWVQANASIEALRASYAAFYAKAQARR
jgi:glycosyltransferase involved in cell wall biosynthesis